jgi:hypothetical protein
MKGDPTKSSSDCGMLEAVEERPPPALPTRPSNAAQ